MKKVILLSISVLFVLCVTAQNTGDSIAFTISGENYKLLEKHFADKAKAKKRKEDWAKFWRYEKANDTITKPVKVVFYGNSITDDWPRKRPDFFAKNHFIGRGISAQTTSEMLVRFRADVIDLKPKAVIILAGVNDIAANNGIISHKHILGNIQSMCELAKLHKITPVLCSVLPANHFRWYPELKPANDIILLNRMLKEYAKQNGIAYVDYHSVMKDEFNGLPENLSYDGVHPNAEGYAIMEDIILKNIFKYLK